MDSNNTGNADKAYDVIDELKSDFRSRPGRVYLIFLIFQVLLTLCYSYAGVYLSYMPGIMAFWVTYTVFNAYMYFRKTGKKAREIFPIIALLSTFLIGIVLTTGLIGIGCEIYGSGFKWISVPAALTLFFTFIGLLLILLTHWLEKGVSCFDPAHRRAVIIISLFPSVINFGCTVFAVTKAEGRHESYGTYGWYFLTILLTWLFFTFVIAFYRDARLRDPGNRRIRDYFPLMLLMNLSYAVSWSSAMSISSSIPFITGKISMDELGIYIMMTIAVTAAGVVAAVAQSIMSYIAVKATKWLFKSGVQYL